MNDFNSDDDLRFRPRVAASISLWWIFVVTLSLIGGAVVLVTKPWFVNQDTRITRESNQYITTKQNSLRSLHQAYQDLDAQLANARRDPGAADVVSALTVQQRGVLRQMREEADLIPRDVQPDIVAFLHTH